MHERMSQRRSLPDCEPAEPIAFQQAFGSKATGDALEVEYEHQARQSKQFTPKENTDTARNIVSAL